MSGVPKLSFSHPWLTLLIPLLIAGCSAIDTASVSPRSTAFNDGWNKYRNDTILSNVVRAEENEPLNFIALSKYTATGEVSGGLGGQATLKAGASDADATYGPFTAGARTGNTAEIGTLDTTEFYSGMLAPIDLREADLLLRNAGANREIVFLLMFQAFRVTRDSGDVYIFDNNPGDDRIVAAGTDDDSMCRTYAKDEDIRGQPDPSHYQPPFGDSPSGPLWTGARQNDCKYHKFRQFIHLALRSGMRIESVDVPNPAWNDKAKDVPRTIVKPRFCYDGGLAREFNTSHVEKLPGACGTRKVDPGFSFEFQGAYGHEIIRVREIEPILRSPIGIFNYLGILLRPGIGGRVRLATGGSGAEGEQLLEIGEDPNGCFAEASHANRHYCVPSRGARNTKAVFSLLAELVALHTKRSDLPQSSALIIAP